MLELTPVQASLEEAFMELTRDSVEYRSHDSVSDHSLESESVEPGVAA